MLKGLNLISIILWVAILLTPFQEIFTQTNNSYLKFDFGNGELKSGYIQVTGEMAYDSVRGYGFVSETPIENIKRDNDDPLFQDFCTSVKPFYFMVDLPEGDYKIKLTFGDERDTTCTTIKAESRRLMLESVKTKPGEYITRNVIVNIRTPVIGEGDSIRLKSREYNFLNWDNKLTVEFNNSRPCINAMEICPVQNIRTVFLAGNSTVVDQEFEPWCSWGQMITNFFSEDIVVTNLAESGEALKSFKAESRLMKLLSMIDTGDYVFIEFGHNDQKPESSAYVEPFGGYKTELKDYITQIKAHGGNPVLVSPVQRRQFDSTGMIINTHGDYPRAMQEVAEEESVPYINLNAMSKVLFETLGLEGSKNAFVHYPANSFPNQNEALADNSHFNNYGAYQLAKCILQGIIDQDLELKNYIVNFESYDPSMPDDFNTFQIPPSPLFIQIKPEGY
jgi:lysophospholipase L1-like esterase